MITTHPTRRIALLSAASLLALAGCSAVTSTTTNGVTTITVNVADINAWAQAFLNGATFLLALPGVAALPAASLIGLALAAVKTDLAAFDSAAGGNVTLTFNSTSIPAAIKSVLTDGRTLLSDAAGVPGAVPATVQATASEYVQALETVVSTFAAAVGQITAGAALGAMPIATALSVLRVK
jgi:hypothetical protein